MSIPLIIGAVIVAASLVMMGAFVVSDRTGKSGWVDATWTFSVGGIGALAALAPIAGEGVRPRQIEVAALVVIWSLRLGLHIVGRTRHGGDDPRYAQLKADWGDAARTKMFWFLQIQAATTLPLIFSALIASRSPVPWPYLGDLLGVLVLLVGVGGEGLADRQLRHFAADPTNRGRVCDVGLWRLTRHPNYFFEWLGWLAYAVIAIGPIGSYPWGLATLMGPATIYWLLVHVSGIPPLEEHMLRSRPDAFRAYQARVNAFWPGWPRAGNGRAS